MVNPSRKLTPAQTGVRRIRDNSAASHAAFSKGVNINPKVFLVGGCDFLSRHKAVQDIKKKILKERASSLHTVTFYNKEIDVKLLQERVFTFSFSRDKIVIFKDAGNLPKSIKDYLLDNWDKITENNYFIFEIEEDCSKSQKDNKLISDKFLNAISKKSVVYNINSPLHRKVSVEDFKWSIRRGDLSGSIYILEKLFEHHGEGKELGPQLLGIIVSEVFSPSHSACKRENFTCLWDTDRAIKEKGMDCRLALQRLIVKLLAGKREGI